MIGQNSEKQGGIDEEVPDIDFEILSHLQLNGPTYTSDLYKILDKKNIHKSTFYRHFKKLRTNGYVKSDLIRSEQKTSFVSITPSGRKFLYPKPPDPLNDLLGLNLKTLGNEIMETLPSLFEKLDQKVKLSGGAKADIIAMWPYLSNYGSTNLSEEKFILVKFFILLNRVNFHYNSNMIVSYSQFEDIFSLDKVELKFYVKKLIEESTYLKWIKFELDMERDVFLLLTFGFGQILLHILLDSIKFYFLGNAEQIFQKFDIKSKIITELNSEYFNTLFAFNPELRVLLAKTIEADVLFEEYFNWFKNIPRETFVKVYEMLNT